MTSSNALPPLLQNRYGDLSDPVMPGADSGAKKLKPRSTHDHFFPASTRSEKLFQYLFKQWVINEDGHLRSPESLPPIAPLPDSIGKEIAEWLDYKFTIQCKQGSFTEKTDLPIQMVVEITLREIIEHFEDTYPVVLVGGTVRKMLMRDNWLINTVEAIPKCQNALLNELKIARYEAPNDFDLRIMINSRNFNDLLDAQQRLLRFIASKFCREEKFLDQCAANFKKKGTVAFSDLYFPENLFTLISFEDRKDKRTADICLCGEMKRDHLFSLDALGIRIYSDNSIALQCSLPCGGWQPVIDNLLNVIHVDSPETLNEFAFARLMGALTRGGKLPEKTVVAKTLQTLIQSSKKQTDLHIVKHYIRYHHHHIRKGGSPVETAYLLNTLTALYRHCSDPALAEKTAHALLIREYAIKQTRCSQVVAYLKSNREAFSIVDAWMQLAGLLLLSSENSAVSLVRFEGEPALQWHDNGSHWTVPLHLEEAIDILLETDFDLSPLLSVLEVSASSAGSYYRDCKHLKAPIEEKLLKGWLHPQPAIRQLCRGLYLMLTYDSDHWENGLQLAAIEDESAFVKALAEKGADICVETARRIYPEVDRWDLAGNALFDFYLSHSPETSARLFYHHFPHNDLNGQRTAFNTLVNAHQKQPFIDEKPLVESVLKLQKAPEVSKPRGKKERKKRAKTVAAPTAVDITDSLLWVASLTDRLDFLQLIAERKLLRIQTTNQEILFVESMQLALDEPEVAFEIWKKIKAAGNFAKNRCCAQYIDMLLSLAKRLRERGDILSDLKSKSASMKPDQKLELQKITPTAAADETFMTREQRYEERCKELESVKGNRLILIYRSAHALSDGSNEHTAILERHFDAALTSNLDLAIAIYQKTQFQLNKKQWVELLDALPVQGYDQLRWELLQRIDDAPVSSRQAESITNAMQQTCATDKIGWQLKQQIIQNWIEKHLHKCSPKTVREFLLAASHQNALKKLENVAIVFKVIAEDHEMAHHILTALHTPDRIYSSEQLEVLNRLILETTNPDRCILWATRLIESRHNPVSAYIPAWIERLILADRIDNALGLLQLVSSPNAEPIDRAWQKLIHLYLERTPQKAAELIAFNQSRFKNLRAVLEQAVRALIERNRPGALALLLVKTRTHSRTLWDQSIKLFQTNWKKEDQQLFAEAAKHYGEVVAKGAQVPELDELKALIFFSKAFQKKTLPRVYHEKICLYAKQNNIYSLQSSLNSVEQERFVAVLTEFGDQAILQEIAQILTRANPEGRAGIFAELVGQLFKRVTACTLSDYKALEQDLLKIYQRILPSGNAFINLETTHAVTATIADMPELGKLAEAGIDYLTAYISEKIETGTTIAVIPGFDQTLLRYCDAYLANPPANIAIHVAIGNLVKTKGIDTVVPSGSKKIRLGAVSFISLGKMCMYRPELTVPALKDFINDIDLFKSDPFCRRAVAAAAIDSLLSLGIVHYDHETMAAQLERLFRAYAGEFKGKEIDVSGIKTYFDGYGDINGDLFSICLFEVIRIKDLFELTNLLIEALLKFNLESLEIRQIKFWSFYLTKLIEGALNRFSRSDELDRHHFKKLTLLFIRAAEVDLPNANSIYFRHMDHMRGICAKSSTKELIEKGCDQTLIWRLGAVTSIIIKKSGFPAFSPSIGDAQKIFDESFSHFYNASNSQKFYSGFELLGNLWKSGLFRDNIDLFYTTANHFIRNCTRFPLDLIHDETMDHDMTVILAISSRVNGICGCLGDDPVKLNKHQFILQLQSALVLLTVQVNMKDELLARKEFTREYGPIRKINSADSVQYLMSHNGIMNHNLLMKHCFNLTMGKSSVDHFEFIQSTLANMLLIVKRNIECGKYPQMVQDPLDFTTLPKNEHRCHTDPLFLFSYAGTLTPSAIENRNQVFNKWEEMVHSDPALACYRPRVAEARQKLISTDS